MYGEKSYFNKGDQLEHHAKVLLFLKTEALNHYFVQNLSKFCLKQGCGIKRNFFLGIIHCRCTHESKIFCVMED